MTSHRPSHSPTQSLSLQPRDFRASGEWLTHSEGNAEAETPSLLKPLPSGGVHPSEGYSSDVIADAVDTVYRSVVTVTAPHSMSSDASYGYQRPSSESYGQALPPSDMPVSGSLDPQLTYPLISAAGSGVVINEKGMILTNAHVVNGASEVILTLWTGDQVTGQVLGVNDDLDMALIQAPVDDLPDDLPIVPLGNSDSLRIGEWAIAIGHPFGLEHTVTVGIISAIGRYRSELQNTGSNPIDRSAGQFIQTDAAINPGNSGGPLLNYSGELIGITTARLSDAQGIGFAVPVNEAKQFMQDILRSQHTSEERSSTQSSEHLLAEHSSVFGVRATVIETEESMTHGRPEIVIIDVIEGTIASRAGIRVGDVIRSIDGALVPSLTHLREKLALTHHQRPQTIDILRDDTLITLHL